MFDIEGFYSLSRVPAGTYTLVVSSMEYEGASERIELVDGKITTRNFLLEQQVIQLGSAEVNADREEQTTKVNMSVETIRPSDLKKIPSFGGQPDLVQALQVLPGFISTGDQGGQLYIRGGSPIQNKVLLDGMIVYNAFHSIGLFSVFDSDVIANADVYTGGFGAKFGGRISSVMDIKTRDGNKMKTQGPRRGESVRRQIDPRRAAEEAQRFRSGHLVHPLVEAQLFGANIKGALRLRLERWRRAAIQLYRCLWKGIIRQWKWFQIELVWFQLH